MSKKPLIIGAVIIIALFVLIIALIQKVENQREPELIKVGIFQIMDHPALNAVRDGFIAQMAELGYEENKNIVYDIQEAKGDPAVAATIAHRFVAEEMDLIVAISTPAAQAAVQATDQIPIVFTAVTDPLAAEIVTDLNRPGGNVTGMSDLTPVALQIDLIAELVPEAETIGTVYNPHEANSVLTNKLAKERCFELGIELVESHAYTLEEAVPAAQRLAEKEVDAVYISTDNVAFSAMEEITEVLNKHNIPLVGADATSIDKGIFIALSFDYYVHGQETAPIAVNILEGVYPGEIPVKYARELLLVINKEVARNIGRLPEEVEKVCKNFQMKIAEEIEVSFFEGK